MRLGQQGLLFAGLLLLAAPAGADEADPVKADEQALREAGLKTDPAALLEFFRRRALSPADQDRLTALVGRLGDRSFRRREQAAAELESAGRVALPFLRRGLRSGDPEVVRRAEGCIRHIEHGPEISLAGAAARLLAVHKPEGTAAVLLAYLPFADDESVAEEAGAALAAAAVRAGTPEPVLVEALADRLPVKRAAAAEALCRAGAAGPRQAVRRLLRDPEAAVRLRAAAALALARDRDAVPVLISLLAELPREQAWRAEDLLAQLAGEQGPGVLLGDDDAGRQRCRDAWAAWWEANGSRADLTRLEDAPRLQGFTLVALTDAPGGSGRVLELGTDGKPRWQFAGLSQPLDLQVVGPGRVLVADHRDNRVTERDLKGSVLWEKKLALPIACQRLANGGTFIATRSRLLVLDRDGKEVFGHASSAPVVAARRLRDGQTVLVTSPGTCTRLDAAGKEIKSFPTGTVSFLGCTIDVLPNGHVLVPVYKTNKVVEFDADGKAVWEADVNNPVSAVRLPNGHTLAASTLGQRVLELNRKGEVVWEHKTDGRPRLARRR
jgi:hypothetical protein